MATYTPRKMAIPPGATPQAFYAGIKECTPGRRPGFRGGDASHALYGCIRMQGRQLADGFMSRLPGMRGYTISGANLSASPPRSSVTVRAVGEAG